MFEEDDGRDGDGEQEHVKPVRRRTCQAVRWSAPMQDAFFTHLAGSCNVAAAARTIGLLPSQVYYRRKTNPAFAAQWQAAIAIAYQVMETRMIGHVLAGGGKALPAIEGMAPEPIAWDEAVKLLGMHAARRDGRAGKRAPTQSVATREQTDAAILGKLKLLADRRQRHAEAMRPASPTPGAGDRGTGHAPGDGGHGL